MTDTANIPVTQTNTAATVERRFPGNDDSSELTIECSRIDYSASVIARAVEDCDAHLLNLNVTSAPASRNDRIVVDLRINRRNSTAVERSLERYGYTVISSNSRIEDPLTVRAREHALELLKYLNS